MIFELICVVKY